MKLLADYTLSSNASSISFTGLDTAMAYNNFLIFYRLRQNDVASSGFHISGNYGSGATYSGSSSLAMTTGSQTIYTFGSNSEGMRIDYSAAGTQDYGHGYGVMHMSNRLAGDKLFIVGRYGMAIGLNNGFQSVYNGFFSGQSGTANASNITSVRFSTGSSVQFTQAKITIYGV